MFSLGYSLLVALGFQRIFTYFANKPVWKYLGFLLLGLTLGVSAARLVSRNRVWATRETLFR